MGPIHQRLRTRGTPPLAVVASFGVAVLLATAGCASPASEDAADAAVSVSVHQSRSNVATRQLSIAVTNDADASIEITGARFVSDQFVSDAVWPKDSTTVRPGATADLPVPLPAADCAATGTRHRVVLTYRSVDETAGEGSGRSEASDFQTLSIEPADPLAQLKPLFMADCLRETAGEIAELAFATPPRVLESAGTLVAELDLAVMPSGGRGSLTVEAVHGTTLFSQVEPDTGAPTDNRTVDVTVHGTASRSVITLQLVPSRCDPHAVAEDKLGTVFPIELTVVMGGNDSDQPRAGTVTVAVSNGVRTALYAFVNRWCQW